MTVLKELKERKESPGLLVAALGYAEKGWPVFPCNAEKRPRVTGGFKAASCDARVIREWWVKWPDALIGVACGAAGLVVVDCDVKHDVDGIENWEALVIPWDNTLVSQTPTAGLHVIYTDTTGGKIRNSAGKLACGVDVRANGGYVIVPPSVTPSGGYTWLTESDVEPKPLPEALRARLAATRTPRTQSRLETVLAHPRGTGGASRAYVRAALAGETARVRAAPEGARNETLNAAAFSLGQLVAGGELSAADVEHDLLAAALHAGLGETEARRTIESGILGGSGAPRTRPEPLRTSARPPMPEDPPPMSTEHVATEDAPRYILYSAADALRPQLPINWVIQNLFSTGSVSLLVGDPKSGKTYAALDAAICVVLGEPWLTHATQAGNVLFVDEESGPRRMARRVGASLRGHEVDDPATPLFYTSLARFDLLTGEDTDVLRDAIIDIDARFVVIDALVDVMPGGDENAAGDVHRVFMALRTIAAETDAAILVIHHTNKAGAYRGSSAMFAAVDALLTLKKTDDRFELNLVASRDCEPFKFAAVGYWQPDMFNLVDAELVPEVVSFPKSQAYVLRFLAENGPTALRTIQAHADTCSARTARDAVYGLTDKGFLERVDGGGTGTTATYALTETGQEAAGGL